jgi:GntR family transcriptional regulator, transcriptional repressor for pyruvate dehydrogenase complex
MFEPLTRSNESLAGVVARSISDRVQTDRLPPGHRLGTKEDLRLAFEVSNGTMSEAIRLLQHDDVIQARPGRTGGIFVADGASFVRLARGSVEVDGDPDEVLDSLIVRDLLETYAALDVAFSATPREREGLDRLLAVVRQAEQDPSALVAASQRLLDYIVGISSNGVLRGIHAEVSALLQRRTRRLTWVDATAAWRRDVVRRLGDVVAAIGEGDGFGAEEAMRAYRMTVRPIPPGTRLPAWGSTSPPRSTRRRAAGHRSRPGSGALNTRPEESDPT